MGNHVNPLSKFKSHEKLALVVFLLIGMTTAVLAYAQIKKSIWSPFVRKPITYKTSDELEQEQADRLKTLDTDKDGLSDYDELYVFHTSPFLADSDSDGVNDGTEVAQGTDPNCPKGKVCRQVTVNTATLPSADGTTTPPTDQTPPPSSASAQERAMQAIVTTFGDPTKLTKETITAKLDAMTSAELRGFIVELGIPESALAKADDATLRKLVEDTLIEIVAATPGSSAPASPATNTNDTPAQ